MLQFLKRLIFRLLARYFGKDDAAKGADKRDEQVLRDIEKEDSKALTDSGSRDLADAERRLRDR